MRNLTSRQREVLDFLKARLTDGLMPTNAEVATHFGFCVNAAHDHLLALHKKGYIEMIPRIARGIRILR